MDSKAVLYCLSISLKTWEMCHMAYFVPNERTRLEICLLPSAHQDEKAVSKAFCLLFLCVCEWNWLFTMYKRRQMLNWDNPVFTAHTQDYLARSPSTATLQRRSRGYNEGEKTSWELITSAELPNRKKACVVAENENHPHLLWGIFTKGRPRGQCCQKS